MSASIFRGPAATFGWWRRGDGCVRARVLRDQVGVVAQPIACALDLDHDGVVQQTVQQRGGDHRIAEDLAPFGKAAVLSLAIRLDSLRRGMLPPISSKIDRVPRHSSQ